MGDTGETKSHQSAAETGNSDDSLSDETSKKTLSDLEDSEKVSGSTDSSTGDEHDPGPSPDGLLDEPDETKDAGPM